MTEREESKNNYFVSVDRYMADSARQKVIQANGQLVTPAFERKDKDNTEKAG